MAQSVIVLAPRARRDVSRPILAALATALAAAVTFLFSDALLGHLFDPNQTGQVTWLRLVWLPVYAAILVLAIWRAKELARFWRPALVLSILVGWAAISLLWTSDPATSQRRVVALVFTTLFGLELAACFDARSFSRLIGAVFAALALATLVVCLALPGFGVHQTVNVGDWKGLWYEKNQMGALMACGSLTAMAAADLDRRRTRLWIAAAGLCALLVVMSRSMTDLTMLVAMAGVVLIGHAARRGPVLGLAAAWSGASVAGLGAAIALLWPGIFYRAIGKDPTLTGRTEIWRAVARWSARAPWLGYGYAGFWGRNSPPALWIRDQLGWMVPNAHDGWLDLRLQLGWVGVVLIGAVFGGAVLVALIRGTRLADGYWSAAFLAAFGLSTLSESVFLEDNSLWWVLCVVALARLFGPAPRGPAAIG